MGSKTGIQKKEVIKGGGMMSEHNIKLVGLGGFLAVVTWVTIIVAIWKYILN